MPICKYCQLLVAPLFNVFLYFTVQFKVCGFFLCHFPNRQIVAEVIVYILFITIKFVVSRLARFATYEEILGFSVPPII